MAKQKTSFLDLFRPKKPVEGKKKSTPVLPSDKKPGDRTDAIIEVMKNSNESLLMLKSLYTLNTSWFARQVTLSTSAQQIYKADQPCVIILAKPALTGENADNIIIGPDANVRTTNGFGLKSVEPNRFILERDAEIWAVSNGTPILHMIVVLL